MISAIFQAITDSVTGFTGALAGVFEGLEAMFVTTTSGGATQLTFLGILILVAAGVGIVYWAFRMIKGLISRA